MQFKYILFANLAGIVAGQIQKGFNYGATSETGACQDLGSFTNLFNRANSLQGTSGFSSARLYTTVQCGTANSPTAAIQAALNTGTSLLLGMWASAGSAAFQNEIAALTNAIQQYPNLANIVTGISVGSEDLYRSSAQGVANNAGVGADAATIESYISQVRRAISGTALASKPIGHVDTWTAWVLPENAGVAQDVDWLGHNSFPYFETTRANSIDQGAADFNSALANTESVSGGKPVWVTETGWPHSGPVSGQAVASVANAEAYWKAVGCSLFGNRNIWWYTLEDANTAQTDISFGVTPSGSNTPVFDLSCSGASVSSSSQSSSQTSVQPIPQSSSTQSTAQTFTQTSAQTSAQSSSQTSALHSTTPSVSQSSSQPAPTTGVSMGQSSMPSDTSTSTGSVSASQSSGPGSVITTTSNPAMSSGSVAPTSSMQVVTSSSLTTPTTTGIVSGATRIWIDNMALAAMALSVLVLL